MYLAQAIMAGSYDSKIKIKVKTKIKIKMKTKMKMKVKTKMKMKMKTKMKKKMKNLCGKINQNQKNLLDLMIWIQDLMSN